MSNIAPFLIFYLGALLAGITRGRVRLLAMTLVPVLGAFNLFAMPQDHLWELALFDYQLTPVKVDRLSLLFGYLFHLATFIVLVFSFHVRDTLQHVAGLLYAGSAVGAIFAGDFLTLFVFWELMALSSVFLIFATRTRRALRAGFRYIMFQVSSGVLLLAGALILVQQNGSLEFESMRLDGVAAWLIFIAFGIKAGFPFLHTWLVDAYPHSTPTGCVFLSAFTTKVAIYALARGFPGTELLIYIGAVMTCFPIFYAVIENDLRRVLTYSMINQLGFMVVGIGIGTELAINGAVSHAFNDVLFKGLLMMSMGAVLLKTGRINGSDLGGLYKSMPKTTTLCIIGAASISAFPLFSGFVSKSMVMSAALSEGYWWIWLSLLFASAGVFHHAGIKIPFFAFFAHDSGLRPGEPPLNMLVAMGLAAVLCVAIGIYPTMLYNLLPFEVEYWPFDYSHVVAQLQLLFFSALAFVWLKLSGIYPPELRSVNLDSDWLFRRLGLQIFRAVGNVIGAVYIEGQATAGSCSTTVVRLLRDGAGPESLLAGSVSTARMVFLVALGLGGLLLFLYR